MHSCSSVGFCFAGICLVKDVSVLVFGENALSAIFLGRGHWLGIPYFRISSE